MDLFHTGQNQKIIIRPVLHNKVLTAIGAAAAAIFRRFAEIIEDHLPQTLIGSTIADHFIQLFHFVVSDLRPDGGIQSIVFGTVFDKKAVDHNIFLFIKKNTFRSFAVASGTTRFLIIAFDIFRHIVMNDKRNIGFINAHAEGVGRHHDRFTVKEKIILILFSFPIGKTGMIPRRLIAHGAQTGRNFFHRLSRGTVDDPAFMGMGFQNTQ